jgi:hypothetical protein
MTPQPNLEQIYQYRDKPTVSDKVFRRINPKYCEYQMELPFDGKVYCLYETRRQGGIDNATQKET